jgi:hypothetical protein
MPRSHRQRPVVQRQSVKLADNLDSLHKRSGDPAVFLDEHGKRINGQWPGSPTPNEHDVLTGSDTTGQVLAGKTRQDWTSKDAADLAQVGHADGLGPMQNAELPYPSWNSSHENGGCNDTAPRGGAGKLYCFAIGNQDALCLGRVRIETRECRWAISVWTRAAGSGVAKRPASLDHCSRPQQTKTPCHMGVRSRGSELGGDRVGRPHGCALRERVLEFAHTHAGAPSCLSSITPSCTRRTSASRPHF